MRGTVAVGFMGGKGLCRAGGPVFTQPRDLPNRVAPIYLFSPPRMDRLLLVIATFCFLFGFAYTMHALGARVYKASRLNFFAILTGFLCQTAFLYVRGQAVGRCPLTSLFEVLIFLSWSTVLFYLLIGPAYRLSLLGAFTSPLAFLFQVGALLLASDTPMKAKTPPNAWLELHAAISVVAYGAFALACVAGAMYLAQERQLKSHNIHSIFLSPAAHSRSRGGQYAADHRRLSLAHRRPRRGLWPGGIFAHSMLTAWAIGVWFLYGFILTAEWRHRISPRRVAWLSVAAFSVLLLTLGRPQFHRPERHPLAMEILCLGLSHHTAPVDLREKFAIAESEAPAVATQLLAAPGVSEAVVVSTCNRVEFYVAAEQAAQGFGAVNEFLNTRLAEPPGEAFFQLPTAAASGICFAW